MLAPSHASLRVVFEEEGGQWRERSIGKRILFDRLPLPGLPAHLLADWERDLDGDLGLQPGDVESLSLPRARRRWRDHACWIDAAQRWLDAQATSVSLADAEIALMACRGARYHHDARQYGGAAFLNLFVTEEHNLEVHFPVTRQRVPLSRGTVLLFDPSQPHAVVPRGASEFDAAALADVPHPTQVFLTWELPIQSPGIAELLDIRMEQRLTTIGRRSPGLRLDGQEVEPCPRTGRLAAA